MISQKKKTKRSNIAKSCFELFTSNGFHNVSVSQIALTAGIGKGTVYEYFLNKEDIVLELMECLQSEYDETLQSLLKNPNTSKEELLYCIFDIFIDEKNIHQRKREILKQFFIATITNPSEAIIDYNTTLKNKYIKIINTKLNDITKSNILYDAILGQYLLSLTLKVDLAKKVNSIIQYHLQGLEWKKSYLHLQLFY